MNIIEKLKPFLSRIKNSAGRPFVEKHNALIISLLVGYVTADLATMAYRADLLPTEITPPQEQQKQRAPIQLISNYDNITRKNIFNEDQEVPPPLGAEEGGEDSLDAPAVLSQLPLQLLGTIVHFNPKMSIATVNITSKGASSSFKVDEEIEDMAKLLKIERKRLTFINLSNRRKEYIEIPEDAALNFGLQTSSAPQSTGGFVEQKSKSDFVVNRSMMENMTKNLSSLLQQARMEPVFSPDGIGIDGFRFTNIQPGSAFEKLGFKIDDMIQSVNGEKITSPTKAMEMYNLLKSSGNVQIGVVRGGREETHNYTIQ